MLRITPPPSRHLRLSIVGVVAVLVSACAGSKSPKRPQIENYTIDGERIELPQLRKGVQLFAPVGNIRVQASATAWLEKSYSVSAADLDAATLIVRTSTVETEQVEGDRTRISLLPPEDCPFEALAADTMLAMPTNLDVDLRTVNGIIDTRNYSARTAKLRTRDGNLIVGAVTDELTFESDSGRIELFAVARSATGKTNRGEIHVHALAPGTNYKLTTVTGAVHLRVPPVVPTQVIYRTQSGALRVTLDEDDTERRVVPREDGWTERRVQIRGAAAIANPCLIVVQSPAGDLTVSRPANARPPRPSTPEQP